MFLVKLDVACIHEAAIASVDYHRLRLIRYTFWPTPRIIDRIELLGISSLNLQCSSILLLSLLGLIETLLF